MPKTNKQLTPEIEPYRSSMAGRIAMAPGYQFKFHKIHQYNLGAVEITDLDAKKKYNTSYGFVMENGKCLVSLNMGFRPFNIPDFPRVDPDKLEHDLTKLLDHA